MRKRSLMGFFFLAFDIGGAGIPKTSHDVFLCPFFFGFRWERECGRADRLVGLGALGLDTSGRKGNPASSDKMGSCTHIRTSSTAGSTMTIFYDITQRNTQRFLDEGGLGGLNIL